MKPLLSLVAVLAVSATSCSNMNPRTSNARPLITGTLRCKPAGGLRYLVYLPPEARVARPERLPLMLFLHGAGERGTDLRRVAIHGPLSMVERGTNFPFIIVAPLCAAGAQWENGPLLQLLDAVCERYPVDTERVYLTGISMGGYGCWRLAADHPERFAAVAPICGGGSLISLVLAEHYEKARLAALRRLPFRAIHGGRDDVVPVEESRRMVDALKRLGVREVSLAVLPDAGHNAWAQTYSDPAFYDWLSIRRRR